MLRKALTIRSEKLDLAHRFRSPLLPFAILATAALCTAQAPADPGVRSGPTGAGSPIPGMTDNQKAFFAAGMADFAQIESVLGIVSGTGAGLGPRFNAESCGQCHGYPALGGTSPATNPQVAAATDQGAANQVPFFITSNGPVREARFPYQPDLRTPDGGVHDLFTISGRGDAVGCKLTQPDFQRAANDGNLIFRIPTPVFGGGLIEAIPDSAILANVKANLPAKQRMGPGATPLAFLP